ncbi:MAG: CHAD domain-containing protein [Acidobacteria bacterium]|nr:CHAD domain-containing protein [Acidobacteriota bacterium]
MAKAQKIEGLDCVGDAGEGIRLVLLTRLGEMCGFREAALDWSDPEGVHDMRVASRRLRSALKDFAPHLPRRGRFAEAREELKHLARSLGEVRDADVAIGELEKLKGDAPAEAAAGLEQLLGERAARREPARERLSRALSEEAAEALQESFSGAVEAATRRKRRRKKETSGAGGESDSGKGRGPSFREAGRAVIAQSWEELEKLSLSLYRPLKPRRLHKMRIAAKRLRYALELFAPCWDGTTKAFAEEVAELQGALGELHDCDEWVAECGALLSAESGETGGGTDQSEARAQRRVAGVWLLGHFAEERARHYRRALLCWHAWEQGDFAARLVACLEESPGAGASS